MESPHSAATGPTKQPSLPLNRPTADASASRPKFGRVVISLENPILPEDTITNTPSLIDGLDRETENDLRITGCKLIQISGILLRLPQVAMATGQVLFQRYYYSKSFVRFPMEVTAMACVVLASKVEEAPRRIRDIINVFHNMKQVRLNQPTVPMLLNEAYVTLKNNVIKAERRILKELGFCVHVKHPHKYIITVAEILGNSKNTELIQSAWSYMNDSLQTNAFVRFPPETIACACIHLSSRVLRVPLPTSPPWYFVFGVDTETIKQVCITILQLYTRNPLPQEELEAKVDIARKAVDEVKLKARQELLRGEARRLDEEDLSTTPTFSQSQTAAYNKHGDGKAVDDAKLNARQELHQGEARRLDEEDQDQTAAYKHGDGEKMDGRRVLVDVERGRTVKGWLPSRLGGGLSDSKSRVQVREEREEKSFGSRDRFDSRRGGAGDREDRDRDRSDRRRRSKSRERERDRRSRDRTSDRDRHKDRYYERGGGFDNDYEQKPSSRGGFYDYDGGMSRKHRSRSKDRSEKKRYARSRSKSPSQDRKRSRYYKNGDGRAAKHGRHHLYTDSGEMEEGEDRSYDREYTRRFHSGQVAIRGEDDYEDSFTNRLCRD